MNPKKTYLLDWFLMVRNVSVMKDLYEKSLPQYTCLGFSPNSKYLATGEDDGKVRVRLQFLCNVVPSSVLPRFGYSPKGELVVHSGTRVGSMIFISRRTVSALPLVQVTRSEYGGCAMDLREL